VTSRGCKLRVVGSTSQTWWSGGVGSTDVAALVGCAATSRDHCLAVWSQKVYARERTMRKQLLEQGTSVWLDWRKHGVGGSEVSSVVGANPYKSVTTLLNDKIADLDGTAGEPYENEAMAWGKKYEPQARELYERLYEVSVPPVCVLHDEKDFMRCSLDGLRSDDQVVVEIKCCQERNHKKLLAIQEIEDPLERQTAFAKALNYYRYQVLYQLALTGASVCHFVAYNANFQDHKKLAVFELYPEPAEQEKLLDRVTQFWELVESREPPPIEFCLPCHEPPRELKLP
jgi:putative phage-type endonuclease